MPPLRFSQPILGGRVLDLPLRRVQISDQCVGAGPRPARGRPSVPPLRRIQRSNQDVGAGPRPAHPEFALGALARQSQAQRWNRTRPNFCKPRAQWPERKHKPPLRFCAPKNLCLTQGVTPVMGVRGKATMSTKCSSGAVPGGVLPNPSLLPAKPSEVGSPGRGGARERAQFSPPGGNGVEWTLRRRAAMGKVTRRPQAAKFPCEKSHPAAR